MATRQTEQQALVETSEAPSSSSTAETSSAVDSHSDTSKGLASQSRTGLIKESSETVYYSSRTARDLGTQSPSTGSAEETPSTINFPSNLSKDLETDAPHAGSIEDTSGTDDSPPDTSLGSTSQSLHTESIENPPDNVSSSGASPDLAVLSSHTASIHQIQAAEVPALNQVDLSATECCCCTIFNRFGDWCEVHVCPENNKTNVRSLLFALSFVIFMFNCIIVHGNPVFWETFYGLLLNMYCSVFSCLFERGRYSKSFWLIYRKRNKTDDVTTEVGQEHKKDKPAKSQADVAREVGVQNVQLDVPEEPGTSAVN